MHYKKPSSLVIVFQIDKPDSAFRRFRKIPKRENELVMSVRPSFRMEQLGSHWTDLHEIPYLSIFSKICIENSSFIKIRQA
jgi:hypothetical protein